MARSDSTAPTPDEIKAYSAGTLETSRFDAIDRWIAAQNPEMQERLFGGDDAAGALASAATVVPTAGGSPFAPDLGNGRRFVGRSPIGAGGMGIVDLLNDQVLRRDIVVKRCRPRRPDEGIAAYSRRLQLFKREAQLTAQLEHPGIVPVHDVGEGPLGEPAFAMKRLEGESLSAIVARRRAGEALDLGRLVEVILRVADAVGYAHSRGVVHRDLKPDNIMVGALGAVYVIDWGLAGTVGTVPTDELPQSGGGQSLSGMGMGTPAWMAPEQFGRVKADPRMDVFALGGLLMAGLTGKGPRDRGIAPGSPEVNLKPLDGKLPRGLVAVARRCLAMEPRDRYVDASEVVEDLRQWLVAGLTSAENPGRFTRLLAVMRRSRGLSATLIGMLVATAIVFASVAWDYHRQRGQALRAIEALRVETPLADANQLRDAQLSVREILRRLPDLAPAKALEARLAAALEVLKGNQRRTELAERLQALQRDFRVKGPWSTQIAELSEALRDCGISLTTDSLRSDAATIAGHPLRIELLSAAAHLQRACLVGAEPTPVTDLLPRLIQNAAPDAAWEGLGALLGSATVFAHDLALPDLPEEMFAAAARPQTCDLMLALFAPQDALARIADVRLREDTGAFWARVVAGRAALARSDFLAVERHALVALGKEPHSVWPQLLLAYVELAADDHASVLSRAVEGLSTNPDNLELVVLRAVGMCGLGSRDEAQKLIDECGAAALLRYHLHHPMNHSIERGISAMIAQGLVIPIADPELTPLLAPKPEASDQPLDDSKSSSSAQAAP
jgi:tRNA A-37 threonylcarbamoyl transferase component Bud32